MCRVVIFDKYIRAIHLFEYFNMSLLARLISVFLKFNICDYLNVCNICVFMCNIYYFLMLFMSFILYKPLAIWPPGHDKSLLIKLN